MVCLFLWLSVCVSVSVCLCVCASASMRADRVGCVAATDRIRQLVLASPSPTRATEGFAFPGRAGEQSVVFQRGRSSGGTPMRATSMRQPRSAPTTDRKTLCVMIVAVDAAAFARANSMLCGTDVLQAWHFIVQCADVSFAA